MSFCINLFFKLYTLYSIILTLSGTSFINSPSYDSNKDYKELTIEKVNNHYYDNITQKNKELLVHNIKIKEDSILFKLFGKNLLVNSIHKYRLKYITPPFKVIAKHNDTIEGVEYKNILGVQFHPELMKNTDILFEWLIT